MSPLPPRPPPSSLALSELLQTAQAGPAREASEAWEELVPELQPLIRSIVLLRMAWFRSSLWDVDSAVQECFVHLHDRLDRWQGDDEVMFRRWMRRLVERRVIDLIRSERARARRQPSDPSPAEAADPAAQEGLATATRVDDERVIAEAIASLPSLERQLIVLVYYDGSSVREAARRTGRSETNAHHHLKIALRLLRRILERQLR